MIQNREGLDERLKSNNFFKHDLWEARKAVAIVAFLSFVVIGVTTWQFFDWKSTTTHSGRALILARSDVAGKNASSITHVTARFGSEEISFIAKESFVKSPIKSGDLVNLKFTQSRSGVVNVIDFEKIQPSKSGTN